MATPRHAHGFVHTPFRRVDTPSCAVWRETHTCAHTHHTSPHTHSHTSEAKGTPPHTPQKTTPTRAQRTLETAVNLGFSLFYLLDTTGAREESKNLRVLWCRALLHSLGALDDSVAYHLLPRPFRKLVSPLLAPMWPKSLTSKLQWIVQRTNFIDGALDEFLSSHTNTSLHLPHHVVHAQVVVLGSGYDTRALR